MMVRRVVLCALLVTANVPAAMAQSDPQAAMAAQYEIASILHATSTGWQTPLGYYANVFTYQVEIRGPCASTLRMHQRQIDRGKRYIAASGRSTQIEWRYVTSIQPARMRDNNDGPGVGILRGSDPSPFAVNNDRDRDRLITAMERLRIACQPTPPRPAPRPTPAPSPAPKSIATPSPAPAGGFYFYAEADRASGICYSRRIQELALFRDRASFHLQALGGNRDNRVVAHTAIPGKPLPYLTEDGMFFISASDPKARLTAWISFDGRPATSYSVSSGYGQGGTGAQRRVNIETTGWLRKFVSASSMTVTLKTAAGAITDSYTFDLSQARLVESELDKIHWTCDAVVG